MSTKKVSIYKGLRDNVKKSHFYTFLSIHTQQINSASLDGSSRFIGGFSGFFRRFLGFCGKGIGDSSYTSI